MELNFTNETYKEKAKQSIPYSKANSKRTIAEAFMVLIKGVPKEDLSNLCSKLQEKLKDMLEVTPEECYELTQGSEEVLNKISTVVDIRNFGTYLLTLAYECIEKDKVYLGDKTIKVGINTSAWISHSLYEAKVAQRLAEIKGLDTEKAGVLGLLHDYGRKYIHDFTHVIKGFEALTDEGWEEEARACLTHSFINAGRCANCDPAEEGFYIDEKGRPSWEQDEFFDDIAEVLCGLKYDEYDDILNIADLMAMSEGVTTPFERVKDVATRKKPDSKNRTYFLSEFMNKLLSAMNYTLTEEKRFKPIMSEEELMTKFKMVSDKFYQFYKGELDKRTASKNIVDEELDEI